MFGSDPPLHLPVQAVVQPTQLFYPYLYTNWHAGHIQPSPSYSLVTWSSRVTCASSYRQQPSKQQQEQQQPGMTLAWRTNVVSGTRGGG
jgi:hypothetical protein